MVAMAFSYNSLFFSYYYFCSSSFLTLSAAALAFISTNYLAFSNCACFAALSVFSTAISLSRSSFSA
jgi:hypothetical protein